MHVHVCTPPSEHFPKFFEHREASGRPWHWNDPPQPGTFGRMWEITVSWQGRRKGAHDLAGSGGFSRGKAWRSVEGGLDGKERNMEPSLACIPTIDTDIQPRGRPNSKEKTVARIGSCSKVTFNW